VNQLHDTTTFLNQADSGTLIAQATSSGSWQLLSYTSPILPIHAALLNTGKVFFFCGSSNNPTVSPYNSYVWDVSSGIFSSQDSPVDGSGNPIDLFCAGQSFLPNGNLMIAGGTLQYDPFCGIPAAFVFAPSTGQLTQVASMNSGRWYPTLLTLGSGAIFALSGLDVQGNLNINPEIYSSSFDTGWKIFSQPTSYFPQYAHLFLLSSGQIFYSGAYMSASYKGPTILALPSTFTQAIAETPVAGLEAADSGNQAASVLLPPAQDQKVMICGGGNYDTGQTTNRVNIIDLTASNPTYTPAASLNYSRMHLSAVLLPDRTVFVCNGSQAEKDVTKGALPAEIYNPATNTWTAVATPNIHDRVYHSIALLLPDGRVVTGGGNPQRLNLCLANGEPPEDCQDMRLEIYSPAYMTQIRPVIQEAPPSIKYAQTITLQTPQAETIKWVHLLKPMATTHSCDTEQRLVDLPITSGTPTSLTVAVTNNPNLAPPGYYMLFIVDNDGVPSVASRVQLS